MQGHLKIYLGYAPGVGKTYQMLVEGQELAAQGKDVVIGYFEPHGRRDTIARTAGLEVIPRQKIEYRGSVFEEMDAAAILRRTPEICLVDEFPHSNIPGAGHKKRWEDVIDFLEHGISVLTTMNIQHLESLNDQVFQITGVRVRETVPDWVMKQAEEVVMVDVTPEALLNRLRRGVVYAPDKAEKAMENFFRQPILVALRELAFRQTAHEVDIRHAPLVWPSEPAADVAALHTTAAAPQDRLLLYITSDPDSAALIRRGRRLADYLRASCIAVAVHPPGERSDSTNTKNLLNRHLEFARNLHIDTRVFEGDDAAEALVAFAKANQVTQILLARQSNHSWTARFGRSLMHRVLALAGDLRITIVGSRTGPTSRF